MASKEAQNSDKLSGKKVKVMIHRSQDKFAVDPVPLSLNGHQITIKRGQEVEIPIEFIEVLDHAQETIYDQVTNQDHSVQLVPRVAHSYPFQVL